MRPEDYLNPEVLRKVGRFDLRARFAVEGFYSGLHASRFKGFSVEFSEHRRYTPGDDLRTVDWKLWARTDRYYVKQFEAETNMEIHLLLDGSASMAYGAPVSKLEYCAYAAAALSYLAIRQGDPTGLFTFGQGVREHLRPRSTRQHLVELLKAVERARADGVADFEESLGQCAALVKRKGMIVLMSDLLAPLDGIRRGLGALSWGGNDIVVLHVLDATELDFSFDGPIEFVDPETGLSRVADAGAVRRAYLGKLRRFVRELEEFCAGRRIDYVPLDTRTALDVALGSFLRKRMGR